MNQLNEKKAKLFISIESDFQILFGNIFLSIQTAIEKIVSFFLKC